MQIKCRQPKKLILAGKQAQERGESILLSTVLPIDASPTTFGVKMYSRHDLLLSRPKLLDELLARFQRLRISDFLFAQTLRESARR